MQIKHLTLLIMAVLLLLVGIFDHSLWTPDEPRVAEIARTMAVTGDYLIPHLAKDPFLEQPPLYYAVTGLFWRVLGTGNEGFGRLSSVLFALGSISVVFFGMRSLYGIGPSVLASLMLVTTAGFFGISHKMVVDNALAFFITAALFSFLLAYQGIMKKGYPVFWLCLAGAFLTKGIIGIAIPGMAVVLFVFWQKDFAVIKRAWVIPGIAVIAAALAAWGGVLYLRGGLDYLYTFFLYNNLGRFMNVGIYKGGHIQPFYHYLPIVFSNGMPWGLLLIPALVFLKKPDVRLKFFYCWFFGGMFLLSLASTKRDLYFLPMYPALVSMVAVWMERTTLQQPSLWEQRWLRIVATLIGLACIVVPAAYVVKLGGSIPVAVILFLVSMVLLWILFRKLPFTLPERVVGSWAVIVIVWATLIFHQVDTLKTYKPFFQEAGRYVGKEEVIGYNLSETVLAFCPFYGGFHAENVSDKNRFMEMVSQKKTRYVLFLPKKSDMDLGHLLASNGLRLLQIENQEKRPTEFWRLSESTPLQGAQ
ncbi:MAG TPA: glycosyltransferase family 39 protein [Desulfomonilia bacterium]|nr:glycosyltransferase family 39 protein [Desulfomonilia bacterium]